MRNDNSPFSIRIEDPRLGRSSCKDAFKPGRVGIANGKCGVAFPFSMIQSREDLALYLDADRFAQGYENDKIPFPVPLEWKFIRRLRKTEYYANCSHNLISRAYAMFQKFLLIRISDKMRLGIPLNTVGPGLALIHGSGIFINYSARIGYNCRLHNGVNIASGAKIGNNIYIAPGAKILNDAVVGNNVAIGANAVVHGEFAEDGVTLAGVPARIINDRFPDSIIIKGYDMAMAKRKDPKEK
jgi:serine O-acetyltransferase